MTYVKGGFKMSNKRSIAIYCRVSTDDQAENGYNLREQEQRIRQYIKAYQEDFEGIIISYIDDGFSAKNLERREMKLLIQDIKDNLISKVVIHNLDRLTRNIIDLMSLIELFEKYNVELHSLEEKIDTKTAVGRFFISMIILIAQWERESTSERTIRGMDQSALEGNYVSGRAPFGYNLINKKLIINEEEALIIREIYDMFVYQEYSINAIFLFLYQNYSNFSFKWTYDRVKIILNNILYAGVLKNKRMVLKDHYPSIVTLELFNEAQLLLEKRNRRDSHSYLFKGKVFNTAGKNLKQKSARTRNLIYLYYVDVENKLSVNQYILDIKVGKYINRFIDETVKLQIRPIIKTLKRKDARIEDIEYWHGRGLITLETMLEIIASHKKSVKGNEKIIQEKINTITYWEDLDFNKKLQFVKKNIEKIEWDFNRECIRNIEFKKNDI